VKEKIVVNIVREYQAPGSEPSQTLVLIYGIYDDDPEGITGEHDSGHNVELDATYSVQ
jgi:hypothetical protein